MHRIDTDTKDVDLFGAGKHGYTEGDPVTGTPATQTSDDWMNAIQEEIVSVIEGQGIALVKADNTQLNQAIAMIAHTNLVVSNWTERPNPSNFSLNGLAYHDGLFVAVGGATGSQAYIATSTDGNIWTARTNPKNVQLSAVTYGAGLFVAVGNQDGSDAYIVTSPDGVTWTERTNPKNLHLYAIAYNGSQFVAVGSPDGTDAYIITSPDGIVWTEQTNPKSFTLYGVAWGNNLFVAVGDVDGTDAYTLSSVDGVTWVERSNPKNYPLLSVEYGGAAGSEKFIAVGLSDGVDTYAVDGSGVSWSEMTMPHNRGAKNITYSDTLGVWVLVGPPDSAGAYILTSAEGTNWYYRSNPKAFHLYRVLFGGGVLVAVGAADGTDAYIITSLRN